MSFGLEKIFLTANYTNFREWIRREEFEQEEREVREGGFWTRLRLAAPGQVLDSPLPSFVGTSFGLRKIF